MMPQYLKGKVKIKGDAHAFSLLLQLMRENTYELKPGKIPLAQLLYISHLDSIFKSMLEKVFKNYHANKEEVSLTLTMVELLCIWQLSSRVNTTDPLVLELIAQIDQEAVNLSHLVDYSAGSLLPKP